MKVTPEDFVRAWEESKSVAEVSAKLGITRAGVYTRGNYYRKRGVKLKPLSGTQRGIQPPDVDSLNQLIARLHSPNKGEK